MTRKTQRDTARHIKYVIDRLAARKNFTTKITMSLNTAITLRIKLNSGYPNQLAHLSNLIKYLLTAMRLRDYIKPTADQVRPRLHKTK